MYLCISIVVIYVISSMLMRRKRNKELESVQKEIMREGAVNVRKFKLRNLFTSNKGTNPINEGKIVAYALVKNDEHLYSVFAVRKNNFAQIEFYKVPSGKHTQLFRDVTLEEWNFAYDDKNLFLIKNVEQVPNDAKYDEAKGSVDTIGNLAPLVHKAILANYIHRIRLREKKLIKLAEEELQSAPNR